MPAKVLLIAPDRPGLSWSSEVELLGGSVQVVPVLGSVTLERLTRATSGQRYTALHIASHGDEQGIDLSAEVLTKERLAQIARHVRADLVFLNACDSAALGQYLACAGVPCVVCHTVDVADVDALRAASYFYEELAAASGDYKRAFDKVNPCDGSFAWFTGAGYLDQAVAPLVGVVTTLSLEMRRLQRVVYTVAVVLVVMIVAAIAALVLFARSVGAQAESPLPTPWMMVPLVGGPPSPSETAPPPPTRHPKREQEDEHQQPTATPIPTATWTLSPTSTVTSPPTFTASPTPLPTIILPTLTPDYPATLTAWPPCH